MSISCTENNKSQCYYDFCLLWDKYKRVGSNIVSNMYDRFLVFSTLYNDYDMEKYSEKAFVSYYLTGLKYFSTSGKKVTSILMRELISPSRNPNKHLRELKQWMDWK